MAPVPNTTQKKALNWIRYFALERLLLRYSNSAKKFRPIVRLKKKKNWTAVAACVLNCSLGIYKTRRNVTFRYDHHTKYCDFYLPKQLHLQFSSSVQFCRNTHKSKQLNTKKIRNNILSKHLHTAFVVYWWLLVQNVFDTIVTSHKGNIKLTKERYV